MFIWYHTLRSDFRQASHRSQGSEIQEHLGEEEWHLLHRRPRLGCAPWLSHRHYWYCSQPPSGHQKVIWVFYCLLTLLLKFFNYSKTALVLSCISQWLTCFMTKACSKKSTPFILFHLHIHVQSIIVHQLRFDFWQWLCWCNIFYSCGSNA